MHTPEYAFEKVRDNVVKGAADLGITYPVALDNSLRPGRTTATATGRPKYLIDANGTVRHIKFGEGDYDVTEKPDPATARRRRTRSATLPPPTEIIDTTPQSGQTPETYLGVGRW